MPRLPSWTDAFLEFTDKTGTPQLFRKWTGIYTVAAALERKVFVQTNKGVLYPNMYVVLVGPAGTGKTVPAAIAYQLYKELEDHHVASTSVSRASLIDELHEAERKIVRPQDNPPITSFNSLAVYSNELGTLIPAYENDFINVVTDLYDCKRFDERKRTAKLELKMPNPQLNFLAATTPSYLNNLMPEGAWDQGFISRTMLIYSGRLDQYHDIFTEVEDNTSLRDTLISDLRQIGNLFGRMHFEKDAVEAFRAWMLAKEEPIPTHPKLQHYNSRRVAHLLKLCMVSCASTAGSLAITIDNYAEAFDWLLEAEAMMPDIFKSMVVGGASRVMDETWHWAYEWWLAHRKTPIPEALLYEFVMARAPVGDVPRIIEAMKRALILEEQLTTAGTGYIVKPRPSR